MGPFLSLLDVVNVSLSTLAVELHSSLTTIQWATSGYLLALALMLPLNGWLVERIGAKSLYLWCFSAFTLCSALCGIAWVCECTDRISNPAGHERRTDGADDADDGARCR
jgi:MFS family permease